MQTVEIHLSNQAVFGLDRDLCTVAREMRPQGAALLITHARAAQRERAKPSGA